MVKSKFLIHFVTSTNRSIASSNHTLGNDFLSLLTFIHLHILIQIFCNFDLTISSITLQSKYVIFYEIVEQNTYEICTFMGVNYLILL